MENGTVKWFNHKKGYGFIERENSEDKDLFVHHTQVEGSIRDGDKVEFEVGDTEKGPNAVKVKRVEGGNVSTETSDNTETANTETANTETANTETSDNTETANTETSDNTEQQ